MKQKYILTNFYWLMLFFVFIIPLSQSYGQNVKVLATAENWSGNNESVIKEVENPQAIDSYDSDVNSRTSAILYSYPGLVAGIGNYSTFLQAGFDQTLEGDTWSYIKLGTDNNLFQVLLGGSLGDVLSSILGLVLLGEQEFTVEAIHINKSGAETESLKISSKDGFQSSYVRVLMDDQGDYLLAIKPPLAYNQVRITNDTGLALAFGTRKRLDVHNIYTFLDSSQAVNCGKPIATSFEASQALGLNLLEGDISYLNLEKAIDNDTESFSILKPPAVVNVGIGNSFSQFFYFESLSDKDASFNITLGMGASVVDLDLLGGIEVNAYNGEEIVYTKVLGAGLINGVDVLGLLTSNNGKATITFGPGKQFDKVEIKATSNIGVGLLNGGLNIYDVERFGSQDSSCPNPNISYIAGGTSIFGSQGACAVDLINFSNAEFATNAVDGNNNSFSTLTASNGKLLGLIGNPETQGMIHMAWGDSEVIPAGTPTYVRIDSDTKVLNTLLRGTLGSLVGNLGDALLGKYSFDVEVFQIGNTTTSILKRESGNGFAGNTQEGTITLVQDSEGRYYLKVVPTQQYHSIKITNKVDAALTGSLSPSEGVFEMKVYEMCRALDSYSTCGRPVSTSFDAQGIGVSILDGLVNNNFNHAINGLETEFSLLQGPIDLNVLGFVSQSFDFANLSEDDASFNVTLQMPGGLVDANLLGSVEVLAFNGVNQVYRMPIINGLIADLDVLTLLENGEKAVFVFGPGRAFDRVEVRVNQGVSLGLLSNGVRIFDVERYTDDCPNPARILKTPTIEPFEIASCATELIGFENVDFPFDAVDGNNESFASLVSSNGTLLNIQETKSNIHFSTGALLPANKTSYIRVDMEDALLEVLLSGTVGNVIGGVVETLIGDHLITVEALHNGSPVLTTTSGNGFVGNADGKVTLVQDNLGRTYFAISPTSSYNSVRVSTQTQGVLGTGGINVLNVYNLCYEIGQDPCWPVQFTSWDQSGLNVGIGSGDPAILQGAGVNDPYKALSNNSSNYSVITQGTLGVGSSVAQSFYFTHPSQQGDKLKVKLQANSPGVLNISLLGEYEIATYLGANDNIVESFTLQQGIVNNIDLLALFESGGIQTLSFDTDLPYDRVEIIAKGAVNISTSGELRIYGLQRVGIDCPEIFTTSPFEEPQCANILVEAANTSEVNNVFDENFDTYATLQSGVAILNFGSDIGVLELGYDHVVKAGTTSYIRFDIEDSLLQGLVSGSLGNLVTGLAESLLLGNHYFTIEVKDEQGVPVLTGNSKGQGATQSENGVIRVMIDKQGRSYLAITPTSDYKTIRIEDHTTSVVALTGPNTMNIYGMCYEKAINSCQDVFATSYEFSGLNLNLQGLGNSGVTNPERAIDINTSNYSEISLGAVALDTEVKQWFYFNTLSNKEEVVNIEFTTQGGVVNLDLLGHIEIVAYNGNTRVSSVDFSNGLVNGINVLQLLQNNQRVVLPFSPSDSYDRISIGLKTLAGVAVGSTLRIYDVNRTCVLADSKYVSWKTYTVNGDPTLTSVKGGETLEYTIHVKNQGNVDITSFRVEDVLPQGLTFSNVSNNGVFDSDQNTVVFLNNGLLPIGATQSFTFTTTVNSDLDLIDTITNIAYVTTSETSNGIPSYPAVDNTVTPSNPDISKAPGTILNVDATDQMNIVKYGSSSNINSNEVAIGDTLTYTIDVTNNSNKAIHNISVIDSLVNTTDVVVEIDDYSNGIVNGDQITFTIDVLHPGKSTQITLKTKVTALPISGTAEVKNIATVSYLSPIDNTIKQEEDEFVFVTSCDPIKSEDFIVNTQELCPGEEQVLSAITDSTVINPVFRWYSDPDLTQLVYTGADFKVNPFVDTTYYVTVQAVGRCFELPAKQVDIVVLASSQTPVLSSDNPSFCIGGTTTISTTQGVVGTKYYWYINGVQVEVLNDEIKDVDGNIVGFENFSTKSTVDVNSAGSYTVIMQEPGLCLSQASAPIVIEQGISPSLNFELDSSGREKRRISANLNVENGIPVTTEVTLPFVTTDPGASVKYYYFDVNLGSQGEYVEVIKDNTGAFKISVDTHGTYVYYAFAEFEDPNSLGCVTYAEVILSVFDSSACQEVDVRKYATANTNWASIITGGVTDKDNVLDTDPTTYSTLTTGVGLLGIGTVWQDIFFDQEIPAGTPVTIKLGKEYSGLMLAGGLSVQGLIDEGDTIGDLQTVAGGLLDLLAADNVVEFTFVPSNRNGSQAYKGVRISQGSLLSVAQNAKVYGVYITEKGNVDCQVVTPGANSNILDVLHGVKDLGLGVASATASVVNPWNAVDEDLNTYATISRGVAVLNQASLTAIFKQPALPTDEVHILIETPANPILELELLKGYSIQRYLGNAKVGEIIDADSGFLSLRLLGLLGGYTGKKRLIISPTNDGQIYDRVEISYGSVVGVLGDFTRVYDISLVPTFKQANYGFDDALELCHGSLLDLDPNDGCTHFRVFTTSGTDLLDQAGEVIDQGVDRELSSVGDLGLSFELGDLDVGERILWVQNYRNGCPLGPRVPLKVQINESPVFEHYLFNNNELLINDSNELSIKIMAGDNTSTLEVYPTVSSPSKVVWEMKNKVINSDGSTSITWINIPFASVDVDTGVLTMNIPGNATILGQDYSGKELEIRAVLSYQDNGQISPCVTVGEIIKVEITKRSSIKSNLNVTQRIK